MSVLGILSVENLGIIIESSGSTIYTGGIVVSSDDVSVPTGPVNVNDGGTSN